MKGLTFTHDDLFTIATDEQGRTYRVLYTTGAGPAYRLEPWNHNRRTDYRGATIREGHPLFPGIEAAEAQRREREGIKPIDPDRYNRMMVGEI